MREVAFSEARPKFSALLAEIEVGGDPVLITRRGKPVAQLSPIPTTEPSDSAPDLPDETNDLQA